MFIIMIPVQNEANQSKDHLASRRTTVIQKLMEIDTEEPGIFTVDDVADLLEQLLAEREHVEQQKTDICASLTILLVVVLSSFVSQYPLFSFQTRCPAERRVGCCMARSIKIPSRCKLSTTMRASNLHPMRIRRRGIHKRRVRKDLIRFGCQSTTVQSLR